MALKNKGFTLAELLLALTVLGLIAAMVIPKLLGNTSIKMRDAKIKESVSVIKQMLSNGQQDSSQMGTNWATYMQTQMSNQFSAATGFTVLAGNGCSGTAATGYTDAKILLKDGTIIRVLSNGAVGTAAGEIDVCIDPMGDSYVNPATGNKGRSTSTGYAGTVDLTAQTIRLDMGDNSLAGITTATTPANRVSISSLNLF